MITPSSMVHPSDHDSLARLLGSAPASTLDRGRRKQAVRERLFGTAHPLTIGGRYQLRHKLGEGGMGVVYLAWDRRLRREVAIKLVTTDTRDALLLREARAQAQLAHPNVAEVFEVGTEGGRLFLAMEYLRGGTLRRWLEHRRGYDEIVRMFVAAGEGLAAAHDADLVHRDFKPDNVMLGTDGEPRVLDFGLCIGGAEPSVPSNDVARTEPEDSLLAGTRAGTPAYMSPEQFSGEPIDARSDQFSFCVALHEALFGERPFKGTNAVTIAAAVLNGDRRAPVMRRRVPAHIRVAIDRGLAVDRERRHPDMRALLAALTRRRSAWPVAGVLALGAGAVGVLAWPADRVSTCEDGQVALGSAFDAGRRAAVAEAFERIDAPFAAQAGRGVERGLEAYAETWISAYEVACEATRRGAENEAAIDRRMACLQQRRASLDALTIVLSDADIRVAEDAQSAVEQLPAVETCSSLTASMVPPRTQAGAISAVREDLARAAVLRTTRRYSEAVDVATGALSVATALDYPPAIAEAQLELGRDLLRREDYDEAVEYLRRAYFIAISVERHDIAAVAASRLVHVYRVQAEDTEALAWARHARALLDASETPLPELRHSVMMDVAWVHHRQGRLEDARRAFDAVVAFVDEQFGEESSFKIQPLTASANIALWQGRWADAVAAARRVIAISTAINGPDHPNTFGARAELGWILSKRGDHAAARDELEAVLRGVDAIGADVNHRRLSVVLNNLGATYERLGDYPAARRALVRAHKVMVGLHGADHPHAAHPLNNLGNVCVKEGLYPEARDYYERARAILEAALGSQHLHVSFPLFGLGDTALAEARYAEAAEFFERAATLRETAGAAVESVETARAHQARALSHIPAQRDRAREIARASLARLDAAEQSPDLEKTREDLESLLEKKVNHP